MNPQQSNTKPVGPIAVLAGESLVGMLSRLVVLTHDAGVPEVVLPLSNTAPALFLVNDEVADAVRTEVEPLIPGKTYRTTIKDAVNPGDELVLADVATPADKGKLRKKPAAAGAYVRVGLAEKAAAAGDLVEWRFAPALIINPSVVTAPDAAAPADGVFAGLNSTAVNPTKADFDALLAQCEVLRDSHAALRGKVNELHTALVANGQLVIA